jgi:hypothetical protein
MGATVIVATADFRALLRSLECERDGEPKDLGDVDDTDLEASADAILRRAGLARVGVGRQ